MISIDRIQRGVAAYISNEIEPQLDGLKKWGIAIASAELISTVLPAYVEALSKNKLISMTGIVDEHLNVDVERLYKRVRPAAEKSPAKIEVPIIGGISFTVEDVDALYNCIVRA